MLNSESNNNEFNFAYLDEQTKRSIRRTLLKAVAIPGHQIPFSSREMPMSYGWGTGGIQVTASVIGKKDVLKVIDQGADDTTNAVNIRRFFEKVCEIKTTTKTTEGNHNSNSPSHSRKAFTRRTNYGVSSTDARTIILSRTF